MPIYEYVCQACHQEQEQLVRDGTTPLCEACGSGNLQKLLSVPAAHSKSESNGKSAAFGAPSGSCGSGCGCYPE